MVQLTPNGFLDAICMMAVYILAIYNYICMKNKKSGTNFFFFVMFITLFSLLYRPSDGDFWGYLADYQLGVDNPYHHMEEFYYWVMALIPNDYLLWRVAIWLPAAIIIAIVFRLLKIPSSIAVTFFLLLALLSSYYYTRNVLALSVLYLAMALFCIRDGFTKKALNTALFLALAFASWFLHKSMPIYILLALVAIVLPFNKKYFIVALITFPLLYGVIILLTSNFIEISQLWLSEGAGDLYLEKANSFAPNWKGVISFIISYAPIIYFYIIAFKYPLPKNNPDYLPYKVFLLFSFFLLYVSFLYLGQGSNAIQGRLYKSSMLPLTYVICLFFKNNEGSKQCKYFIYLLVIKYAFEFLIGALSVA